MTENRKSDGLAGVDQFFAELREKISRMDRAAPPEQVDHVLANAVRGYRLRQVIELYAKLNRQPHESISTNVQDLFSDLYHLTDLFYGGGETIASALDRYREEYRGEGAESVDVGELFEGTR